ncbi:MAG: hypothetical protein ACKVS8_09970 [Phycisphaerales bacterium]
MTLSKITRTALACPLTLVTAALVAGAFTLAGGCCPHQRVVMGNTFTGENTPPTFTGPVCLRVERKDQIVTFLVRPNAGEPSASAALLNSDVELDLEYGTAFASGVRPVVKGVRTNAAANGTGFGMRITRGLNGEELVYVHSGDAAFTSVVRVSTVDADGTLGRRSVNLAVGQGSRYRYASDLLEVFDLRAAPPPGAPVVPPEILALAAETRAVLGAP